MISCSKNIQSDTQRPDLDISITPYLEISFLQKYEVGRGNFLFWKIFGFVYNFHNGMGEAAMEWPGREICVHAYLLLSSALCETYFHRLARSCLKFVSWIAALTELNILLVSCRWRS